MLLNEIWANLGEANVIGTAVGRREIPSKYKQYEVIGQGSTSLILKKTPDTVLVLTRDEYKVEWLTKPWGLGVGREIETFQSKSNIHSALHPLDITVVEMPLLFPLSKEHRQALRQTTKKFDTLYTNARIASHGSRDWRTHAFRRVFSFFVENYPDSPITHALQWASNYDMETIDFDFLMRNFMQTRDGEVIAVDPIVTRSLADLLRAISSKRTQERHMQQRYRSPYL